MATLLPPEKAIRLLQQQLKELMKLMGVCYQQAWSYLRFWAKEEEWIHFTENIIELAFGIPSTNLTKFHNVRQTGNWNSDPDIRLQMRIDAYGALLRSLIRTLELKLPEEQIKRVYPPGDEYAFYRDLNSIVESANDDILIVDRYLNENVFNLHVDKVPDATAVRILSGTLPRNVITVAEMYVLRRYSPDS